MKRICAIICTGIVLGDAVYLEGANGRTIEVSGGYALLHLNDGAGTFPIGWNGALAIKADDWFAVVGEIGGCYKTYNNVPPIPAGKWRGHNETVLGGPRFTISVTRVVSMFGQVLLGAQHSGTRSPTFDLSVTRFAWQPGAGIDVSVSTRWAVRFEGDYRPRDPRQERFMTGLVFRP